MAKIDLSEQASRILEAAQKSGVEQNFLFIKKLIANSSRTGEVVLDLFGGSGTTLIACEQSGRICYTAELDEKFCDVIVKRYIEQVGSDEKVSVLRDGKEYKFNEVCYGAE